MSKRETYLVFRLDGEPFSVPVRRVEEVLEYEEPTCIPRAPEYLLGIVNVRGRLIPVLDLRRRFELPPAETTVNSRYIVLSLDWEGETVPLGVLADAVEGVIEIDEETIADPPAFGARGGSFLRGTTRHNDAIYMVLEVDSILTAARLHEDFAALAHL
jgi:purine-binding chemotaxis protein CheW